jgi:integrase
MAAQINGQLEVGAPAALSYEPISVSDLRQRWLDHHEHVRRSSLATIKRYRAATDHLLTFVEKSCPVRHACDFRPRQATEFVRHLRTIKVAPNGHPKARKRPLLDTGIKYILETCCSLFNYAQRNRHLSPYAENPFRTIEVSRMPVEDFRPVVVFTEEQECRFLKACDDWQFPLFLTLLLTGLRPGELCHLLLPEDLDLETGWLYVRNKAQFGWQVKTRNQRDVPLVPVLNKVLRHAIAGRSTGPVFRQRRFSNGREVLLANVSLPALQRELALRVRRREAASDCSLSRTDRQQVSSTIWRDLGAIDNDLVRREFINVMTGIGMGEITAPKTLRHTFATILQDANVDPLIRNELMGHMPAGLSAPGGGLAMTAVYTHTRPETKRRQLDDAFAGRAVIQYAEQWLNIRCSAPACLAEATNPPAAAPDVSAGASGPMGHEVDGPGPSSAPSLNLENSLGRS